MALEDEQQIKIIKTLRSSSSSSESFPTGIIFEILSRLPVESLLRCKSVCKSWLSLISDPHFIKYHLTLSTTNHHYTHHHLLVCSTLPITNLETYPLYDVLYDHNLNNPLELDYPMKDFSNTVSIVGSYNGLICIAIEPDSLFIWNPSTRKSIKLPDRPPSDLVLHGVRYMHGFGYNESSDDYKVVEISSSRKDQHDNKVMIYSSRNGNWKEIDSFPQWVWFNHSIIFIKGALHWIASSEDFASSSIASLDLANETYGEVLPPVDHEFCIHLKLGILGDCFCVLCDSRRNSRCCVDVWVMKVYGVKDSWFKLVSVPYVPETSSEQVFWGDRFLAPLCVSDDGKVLVQIGSRLIVFDSKNDSALVIRQFNRYSKAYTFVESLVSPAGHEA